MTGCGNDPRTKLTDGDQAEVDRFKEMADRVERALRTVSVRLGPNAVAILREGGTVGLSGGEYSAMALAVAMMLAGEEA